MLKLFVAAFFIYILMLFLVKNACDYSFNINETFGFDWSYGGEQCISEESYIYILKPKAEFIIDLGEEFDAFEGEVISNSERKWKKQPNSNCWERGVFHHKDSIVTIASYCSNDREVKVFYSAE